MTDWSSDDVASRNKYEKWIVQDGLLLIQDWARTGLSEPQIAHNMGISYSTLKEWKKRFPAISATLKQTKDVTDVAVENAVFKKAMSGDVAACIFWLKNRRPDKWRDKVTVTDGTNIEKLDELISSIDNLAKGGKR